MATVSLPTRRDGGLPTKRSAFSLLGSPWARRPHELFEEQRPRRAHTWRYAALSGFAAAIVGVPFAMFMTPLVYLLAAVVLRVGEDFVPAAEALRARSPTSGASCRTS